MGEYIIIGSNIPKLLQKNAKSIYDLALETGLSRIELTRIIKLKKILNIEESNVISKALNCYVDDLYLWKECRK